MGLLPNLQAKALQSLPGRGGRTPLRGTCHFFLRPGGPFLALTQHLAPTWLPSASLPDVCRPCSPASERGPVLCSVALGCCVRRADGALSPRCENQLKL